MTQLHDAAAAQTNNRYILKERIGAGGMGTVYRAFDAELKRYVALKVLNSLDPASLERFVREREITADLDHPNLVRVLATGYLSTAAGRRPFYTMPLVRGETLTMTIQRRRNADEDGERLREEFSVSRLVQMVQQICLALGSAHDRSIIHRDLKPDNIILGPHGEVYVLDFGLAKYVSDAEPVSEDGEDAGRRDEGTSLAPAGTPYFIAPEQILDPDSADARTDIFGLGAILYYILTGSRPAYRLATERPQDSPNGVSDSGAEAAVRALHGSLIPPEELAALHRRPGGPVLDPVDPALSAVCTKALARSPEDRYPSCRALWQELQQYLEGRIDMILRREAEDLTRTPTRRTLPAAVRNYELAERGLRQRITQREGAGRLAIEEQLDLFDLLVRKAEVYRRRGDSDSIIRSVTRAEPIVETALHVVQSKFIQLLMAKGAAQAEQMEGAEAKETMARALALSRTCGHEDLIAAACCGYGNACAAAGGPGDLAEGRRFLEESIALADRRNDAAQGASSRVHLARLLMKTGEERQDVQALLESALRLAGDSLVSLCEVNLALGSCLMDRDPDRATRHAHTALGLAQDADARDLLHEAHFLLGQTWQARGDAGRRTTHLLLAQKSCGSRRVLFERRLEAFCSQHRLSRAEIGMEEPDPQARTDRDAADAAPITR